MFSGVDVIGYLCRCNIPVEEYVFGYFFLSCHFFQCLNGFCGTLYIFLVFWYKFEFYPGRIEGRIDMSRTCEICGKHTVTGNKVSHAKNHSRRVWKPNLVRVKTELGGTALSIKLCTRCLKSDYITKKV